MYILIHTPPNHPSTHTRAHTHTTPPSAIFFRSVAGGPLDLLDYRSCNTKFTHMEGFQNVTYIYSDDSKNQDYLVKKLQVIIMLQRYLLTDHLYNLKLITSKLPT